MNNNQLDKAFVGSLLKPRVRLMRDGKPTSLYYGFGFGMDSTEYGIRYQHTGNNGNFTGGFMFFKDKKSGVVVFTNGDNGAHLYLKLADLITYGNRT